MTTDINALNEHTTSLPEKKKLHQFQILLWVGLGSIIMAFAGLTSAYIVKKSQANWLDFDLPNVFWASTAIILVSSFTMQMAVKKYKEQQLNQYQGFMTLTAILGVVFLIMQYQGFMTLEANNIALTGPRSNSAGSFLLVITSFHMLHVLGGVVALVIVTFRAFSTKTKTYNALPVELASTYWHFVDILWIYLFVFFNWVG
jgi:cytochrome c oxidase subunit 3